MARKKRFTKKMLEIYDKAEIRRIAINAMNLPTESAYMMDFKSITGWVFENADVFSQVDITEEVSNGFFRDGVFGYTLALQRFIRGEGEAPEEASVSSASSVAARGRVRPTRRTAQRIHWAPPPCLQAAPESRPDMM